MATIGLKASEQKLQDDFDNFNFDDFNFDVEEPKDDRHPVLKTIAPIGRGAKDYITNSSNIEKFVKAAMPKGYGQAYDLASDATGELKQLYNSAAEELKPAKDTAKKLVRKALPSLDGKIPKGLKQKLEDFSKADEQWQGSQRDGREEQLGALLSSIFEQKAKDEQRQQGELNEREKIRQGFEQIRHRDQVSQLDAIRVAVEAQAQYQNRIGFNVQKKQLELSYRMFWAMADLNKEQKRSNAELLTELKATRINTGLPDYVKQTTKEKFKELARNKFLDSARETMFGGAQNYLKKFFRNFGEQAVGQIRNYSQAISGVGDVADSMNGMEGMPGVNLRDEIIAGLMQFPMDWAAGKGAAAVNKQLGKNRGLRRGASKAEYVAGTAGDRLKEYLSSAVGGEGGGMEKMLSRIQNERVRKYLTSMMMGQDGADKKWGRFDKLREILQNSLPSAAQESQMEVDTLDKRHEARPWSRSNSKSIDEVIPGLLARIHREIKILRTGDESTGLLTYDFAKNRFTTDKQLGVDLRQRLGKDNAANVNRHVDAILNKVDRSKKLTPEQREKARQALVQKTLNGESIDISNIWKGDHWGGGADGEAIAGSFNRYLRASNGKLSDNDQSYKRQLSLLGSQKELGKSAGDPRALLQQMVNAGQLEQLQQMGIINDKNQVDFNTLAQWLIDPNAPAGGSPGMPPPPPRPPSTTGAPSSGAQRQNFRIRQPSQRTTPRGPGVREFAPRQNNAATVNRHGEEMLAELRSISAALRGHGEEMLAELRSISAALRGREEPVRPESTVEKNVQSIADLLAVIDAKYTHAADAQFDTLTMMLQRLTEIAAKESGGGAGGESAPIIAGNRQRAYTSLWEHLKGTSREGLRRAKVYGNMAKRKGMRLWDKYAPQLESQARQAATYAGGRLRDLQGKLSDFYGDVVVSGESFPRLRANLLKAGEYRDKITGRVITSLDDITGDVVDSAGNVVITMEEFYNSYVTGNINKRVKELFSKAKSRLEDWKTRLQDFLPDAAKKLKSRALGVLNKVKQMLPPYDVYVKTDMKRPLMYANMMRYEMYFSQRTGKTIGHPRDIDGPVIDEQGNIVVSEEHLKQGLVDVAGDPVGNGLGRIVAKVARKAGAAWELMRDAAVGLFGSISKGLGNVGEYFKNFFAPFTDMITNSRKTVTLLEKIHDLLDNRLPGGKKVRGDLDGDGIRDGSIEDIHRQQQAKQNGKADKAERDAPAGGKNGGLIGKLLAGIGGLFNRKKKDKDEDEDDNDDGFGLDDVADLAEIYDAVNGDGPRGDRGSKERRKAARRRLKRMKNAGRPGFFKRMAGKAGSALGRVGKWGMFNTDIVRGAGKVGGAIARPIMGLGGAALTGAAALGGKTARTLAGNNWLGRTARWGMFNTDIVKGMGRGAAMLGRGAAMLGRGAAGVGSLGAKLLPKAGLLGAAAYGASDIYKTATDDTLTTSQKTKDIATTGASIAGGWAGAKAGAALGATAGSFVPVVGTAIGGVLGGLAGGAFGYWAGGSLAKKLGGVGVWWGKAGLSNLSKLRLAEYGVAADDKDGMEKVFKLEAMLEPLATVKEDGNLFVNEKELDFRDVAELFEVNRRADMELFNLWYRRRFVPVYRFWLTELRKVRKDGKMKDIESIISGKDKLTVADRSLTALGDAFSHMVGWNQARPKLMFTADGIKQLLDSMRVDLMKEREDAGGAKAKAQERDSVGSTTTEASALAQKALTDKATYTVKDKDGNEVKTEGMELGQLTEKIKKGELMVNVAVVVPKNLLHSDKNTLDALTSIRYKAYGLTAMTVDKARTLSALEMFLGDYLDADTENPKLSVGTEMVMKVAGEVFGVPNSSGEHARRWRVWFNGRFLPVFLLWAGAIRKKTGKAKLKEASDAFQLSDQVALARSIIGAQGTNESGGRVSIWYVTTNPWSDNYELNTDPDSTAGNLEAIRQLTDKVKLGEVTGKPGTQGTSGSKASQNTNGVTPPEPAKPGFFSRMFGTRPNEKGVNATGDKIITDKEAKPIGGMGDSVRFGGSESGNYTDLPVPQGAGWGATRELLLKAAAMAGIDPKALIATVAVESGFNPNAAPKNPNLPSSAKGLGQHLDGSWREDLNAHGKKFGIPNGTGQFDARASALMTAMRLKSNGQQLQQKLGRSVTVTDMYLAHLMGLAGATKFLKSPENAIGVEVAPTAAKQHPNYFYENGKALTVKEVYAKFAQKLAKRPAEFGVTEADMKSTASAGSSSNAPAASSTAPAAPAAAPAASAAGTATPAQAPGSAPASAPQQAPAAPTRASSATVPSAGSTSLNTPVQMDNGKGAVMGTGPAMAKGAKYELILQREESEDDGMYGTLRFPDGTVLNTLELPWRDNQPQVSSIPPGQYECSKRPTKNFGAAYEVKNVPGRTGVLIHAGNSAGDASKGMKADSKGCILLGMDRGRKGTQKVITASKAAMQLFYEKMQDQPFTLIIRNGKNTVATSGDKKASMSFDPVRQPAVSATVAPKQDTPPQAGVSVAPSKPQGPRPSAGYAGSAVATSADMPRVNTTSTGLSTTSPSKTDMQQRDEAISAVIAPKIESMANTLLKSLEVQSDGVGVLREILGALKGSSEPQKAPATSVAKAKPETSNEVPVPQRRSF